MENAKRLALGAEIRELAKHWTGIECLDAAKVLREWAAELELCGHLMIPSADEPDSPLPPLPPGDPSPFSPPLAKFFRRKMN